MQQPAGYTKDVSFLTSMPDIFLHEASVRDLTFLVPIYQADQSGFTAIELVTNVTDFYTNKNSNAHFNHESHSSSFMANLKPKLFNYAAIIRCFLAERKHLVNILWQEQRSF
ncbi:hypothetical protein XENORESO_003198 [Xenotaenia resolanae]|uniref:Uncharacterized protein n=1 Tax=Xenotaenia resolanae TaxID=208358 RepID=A0ABV0VTW8_9TELE